MKGSESFVKYQLPALIWCIAIFGLSALPGIGSLRVPIRVDKLVHGTVYFILCFLVWRAFFYQSVYPVLKKQAILFAYLFTCLYGVVDEFHQIYVPGRTPDPLDALADGTGALAFVLVLVWWSWREKRLSDDEVFDKR